MPQRRNAANANANVAARTGGENGIKITQAAGINAGGEKGKPLY